MDKCICGNPSDGEDGKCSVCREGDKLAAWLLDMAEEQKLQKDHDEEVSTARRGY